MLDLLSYLHTASIEQETAIFRRKKVSSLDILGNIEDRLADQSDTGNEFDKLSLSKLTALDERKRHFV